jgi:hypothetical protein
MMDMSINFAYLFQGINRGLTHLEEETYILEALKTNNGKHGYQSYVAEEIPDDAYVSRWPENKLPLKVYAGPDYGYLFSPLELKQLAQIVQSALLRLQEVNPDVFQFTLVTDRRYADVVMKFRRSENSSMSHCIPEIGREKQIVGAEIILNIPRTLSHSRVLLEVVHNMLHALGVSGHSDHSLDTAAREWSPSQQILTLRDVKTLQFLYRCPIGMTKRDLTLLWQEYQNKHLVISGNSTLDAIISNLNVDLSASMPAASVVRSAELSQREVALQESFSNCIKQLKTA